MAFVCSLGTSQQEAEDIVQKVFIKFWSLKEKYNWDNDPKPYLFKASKNAAYNHFRDLKKLWDLDKIDQEIGEEPPVLEKIELEDLENHIDSLIDSLPPRCRAVFVLSRKEGLNHKQIADIMEISVKTVENQITKALKIIRDGIKY